MNNLLEIMTNLSLDVFYATIKDVFIETLI
jgi:hypothetical protein